jgi:hypothetical protein
MALLVLPQPQTVEVFAAGGTYAVSSDVAIVELVTLLGDSAATITPASIFAALSPS